MKTENNYMKIIVLLKDLHGSFPKYNMGRHISTALESYGDIWGLSDKELLFALEKYHMELSLDIPHSDDVSDIITQGMNLDTILDEDPEEGF